MILSRCMDSQPRKSVVDATILPYRVKLSPVDISLIVFGSRGCGVKTSTKFDGELFHTTA